MTSFRLSKVAECCHRVEGCCDSLWDAISFCLHASQEVSVVVGVEGAVVVIS